MVEDQNRLEKAGLTTREMNLKMEQSNSALNKLADKALRVRPTGH